MDGLNDVHLSVDNRIQALSYDISALKIAADELVVAGGAELLFHTSVVGRRHGATRRRSTRSSSSRSRDAAPSAAASSSTDRATATSPPGRERRSSAERAPHVSRRSCSASTACIPKRPARRGRPSGDSWKRPRQPARTTSRARSRSCARSATRSSGVRTSPSSRTRTARRSTARTCDQLTRGELQGRQQVKDTFAFIKQVTPGFQDSYVVDIAPSDRHPRDPAHRRRATS